jgi:hypothetical protein
MPSLPPPANRRPLLLHPCRSSTNLQLNMTAAIPYLILVLRPLLELQKFPPLTEIQILLHLYN